MQIMIIGKFIIILCWIKTLLDIYGCTDNTTKQGWYHKFVGGQVELVPSRSDLC